MKGLSHDEHQHVAAGALIAREGLLPYVDFPFFHTPYLPYLYALLFSFSDHLLLTARLFTVTTVSATVALVATVGWQLFRPRGRTSAAFVAGGMVLLCVSTHLFSDTVGYAWNHEPPVLFVLAAFLAHLAGLRQEQGFWFGVSGVLLGVAVGMRLTYAPLVAPFGLALLLLLPRPRWRPRLLIWFAAGLLAGSAGIFYFFIRAPEQAFFGNFEFARVNIVYRFSTGEPRTMTVLTKLRYFFKEIIRSDFPFFIGTIFLALAPWLSRSGTHPFRREIRLICLMLPFLLVGAFAPSPLFNQYFYPLVPFLALLALYSLASIPKISPWSRRSSGFAALAVLFSVVLGARGYRDYADFFSPSKWATLESHARGGELNAHLPSGRILTLAPIHALEAGLEIYPSFVTGPIAWRVSPFLAPAKAEQLGMITPTALESVLVQAAPDGILVGFEETGEDPLISFAKANGYQRHKLEAKTELWIKRAP